MPKDLVGQIAGESEESQSLREQLNKKLWILTKGSDTCKRFVGIRGLGKRTQLTFILVLTKSVELNNELQASLQQNRARLSSSSCSSIELHEEADAIDSESVDEQSRSPSPDLPEQPAKYGYALEHTKEPEKLLAAPIPSKSGKKKTKKKAANKLQSPVEPPGETPTE
jgi:hypothetical protein